MNQKSADSACAHHVGALCVMAALSLAVFYHGPQIPLLAGALFLLVAWIASSVFWSHANGIRLPLTPVSVSLSLFWLWLGVSLAWSAVPVTSVINFWWIGSIALVFWAYTLAPARDRVWFYVSRFALAGALVLCAYALLQRFAWGLPPRSTFVNIHSFAALMMLIALPLGGYFLRAWHERARQEVIYGLGVCLFVLFFTIALTEGRGTALSIAISTVVLAVLAARLVGFRPVFALVGITLLAYVAANLSLLASGVSEARLATLVDPASAGIPRFMIWSGSWEMLMANPWWGIGLGTYYLAWPPYRHPEDATLGFFVHNDYLQLWIEAGLPALLLLLAVYVCVVLMLVRLLRHPRAAVALRVETIGLFAGLLAVAAHSFVDFNLYILPISIVAGLVLGRLHERVNSTAPPREHVMKPAHVTQQRAYRVIVVLLALFPLSYFVALGASDYLYKRAFALAAAGKLPEADNAFVWSERLLPRDDKVLIMHADLYRHVLARLPTGTDAERLSLYETALALIEEAESANPYRPLAHSVRARLLQENRELAGAEWRVRAEASYAKALRLDPRFFLTRVAYAALLLDAGRDADAYEVLDGGMAYWYYPSQDVLAYYGFTAQVARRLGNDARADEIERQMEQMRQSITELAPARPVVPDVTLPATASTS